MLVFEKAQKEKLYELKPYFAAQKTHISDFSLGFQFMWHKMLSLEFTVSEECLVFRERFAGKVYYYYPISADGNEEAEERAIWQIEKYCRDQNEGLCFTNVPARALQKVAHRSCQEVHITNIRRWRDYLYRADDFKTFAGGKYAGQRNHVNKFKKTYPDWQYRPYTIADESALKTFLWEYERIQRRKNTVIANEEMDEVYAILPYIIPFGLYCGLLTVGDKIVAFSVGERCGDMVIVHIEKALREYEGVYPVMAQEFARAFCGDGVKYLNRMDDAGDKGLRKSKLQYLPCELVDKYNVMPLRAIDRISRLPVIYGERVTLAPVKPKDAEIYHRLAADKIRNRYWGYDWSADSEVEEPPASWFLAAARKDFKDRREMPFGIYEGGKLVGEVVLHRFGYHEEAEVGVRVLPEEEGKGYATEAVARLIEYAFYDLGLERVEAKRYLQNERSGRMLEHAGMRKCGEDETFVYYYKTPEI